MPLDFDFLRELKQFLNEHQMPLYSEHLSYCGDRGHLYDLLPLPFTEEAAIYTAQRIRQAQDALERRIAIENISYYAILEKDISEAEFSQSCSKPPIAICCLTSIIFTSTASTTVTQRMSFFRRFPLVGSPISTSRAIVKKAPSC